MSIPYARTGTPSAMQDNALSSVQVSSVRPPLCIDLEGTLMRSDTFLVMFSGSIRNLALRAMNCNCCLGHIPINDWIGDSQIEASQIPWAHGGFAMARFDLSDFEWTVIEPLCS